MTVPRELAQATFHVRPMSGDEVDIAVEWAAAEGWNPGAGDATCFHKADAGGFLVGVLGEEPISTISVVRYGESFGFLGFYIVKPPYRGAGYGLRTWNAGLERLKGRVIGLDGVVDQQENYKRSGFAFAYNNVRYEGTAAGSAEDAPGVVALSTLPFEGIAAYDAAFFPEDRTRFLRCWIDQPRGRALGFVRDGALAGYGVLRPCRNGYKVGPLFADDAAVAESLFVALQADVRADAPVYLDTPAVNAEAVALARRHGMKPVFETARMYRGRAPELPLPRLFGVTSFELG